MQTKMLAFLPLNADIHNSAVQPSFICITLEYHTAPSSFSLSTTKQTLPCSCLKNVVHTLACQATALEVLFCADPFPHVIPFLYCDEFLRRLSHFFLRYRVVAEILFQPHKDDGDIGTAVEDFGMPESNALVLEWGCYGSKAAAPFRCDVLQAVWARDGEGNKYYVCLAVG